MELSSIDPISVTLNSETKSWENSLEVVPMIKGLEVRPNVYYYMPQSTILLDSQCCLRPMRLEDSPLMQIEEFA